MLDQQTVFMPVPVPADPVVQYLPREFWDCERDYFAYSCDYDTLPASARNSLKTINIENDSDFLVLELTRYVATASAGTTEQNLGLALVNIQDVGKSPWFDTDQFIDNVFGKNTVDGKGPTKLAYPRWVKAGSSINVYLTNLEANARRYMLQFAGVRIYRNKRR